MADEVKLPRLGQGMESGTIVKWVKAEGDQVEKGEQLYELDTDKETQEVELATARPAPATPTTAIAPTGEVERVPQTSLRRTIARRLTEAWQAQAFQIAMSADMTRTQSLHTLLAAQTKEGEPRPTVTDILTTACADALMRHRAVNALWAEDAIEL